MLMHDSTRRIFWRLLACTAVGVAMAGTTYLCAFRSMRSASPYQDLHLQAFHNLRQLKSALEEYRKERGSYPEHLADLKATHPDLVQVEASGQVLDPWRNPYQYRVRGGSYTLLSLGIDGKPGGVGLAKDADARQVVLEDGGDRYPGIGGPTLWQFTFNCDTGAVKVACALAGTFAFVTCLVTMRDERVSQPGSLGRLLTTLAACFLVTMLITILHTPNHH